MKIVEINETFNVGSTGKLVFELSQFLVEKGNDVLYVYSTGMCNTNYGYRIGNKLDHKIHAFLSRLTCRQAFFSYFSTRKLIKAIDIFEPNVIHLHNLHGNFINLPLLFNYINFKRIALVITLHDQWFYTGKCVNTLTCEKFKNECYDCELLHLDKTNPAFLIDNTKNNYNFKKKFLDSVNDMAIICVSDWMANETKKSFLKNKRIVTIHNWINGKIYNYNKNSTLETKEKYHIKKDKIIVLFVAQYLTENKGYKEILFLSNRLDDNYLIVFVGKCKRKIPNRVLQIGQINNSYELAALYNIADVTVNVTKAESFGLVTLESLYCGTPVIVYNNSASPYFINENNGRIINNGDMNGVLHAVYEICKNNNYNKHNISSEIRTRYNCDKSLNEYLDVYKSMIYK